MEGASENAWDTALQGQRSDGALFSVIGHCSSSTLPHIVILIEVRL